MKELSEYGYSACALTDTSSISAAVDFSLELKKKNIKPILGSEFLISSKNPIDGGSIVCLAKNKLGWNSLVKLTSLSNNLEKLDLSDRPTLNLSDFAETNNLICIVGHANTTLANILFTSETVYLARQKEDVYKYIKPTAEQEAIGHISLLKDLFGKDNVFIDIHLVNQQYFPVEAVLTDFLRDIATKTGTKIVAGNDPHYLNPQNFADHKLILASLLKTTFKKFDITSNPSLSQLYHSPYNCLFNKTEMDAIYSAEEIENTELVAALCEDYAITRKPQTPKFPCPDGLSELAYLRKLSQSGFSAKQKGTWDFTVYTDRVTRELGTIEKAGLPGYFLIVQDYVNWAKSQGIMVGPGRGSAAGSLISYLVGITMVDPIPFDLLFERFYNDGRNTADRIAYPDIDIDFPISRREDVINYVRNKYGHDRVSQMVTFGRMQGRGALKEVLRVHQACDNNTMNDVTKDIPHEHQINDKLEEEGEESILRWTLENDPDAVKDYCRLTDGKLTGDFAQYFEQAIRLEGTYRSQGKHAAGIIISADVLSEVCPMITDKSSNEKIAGMEMDAMEKMGHLKLDFLGLAILDKLMLANQLLSGGL